MDLLLDRSTLCTENLIFQNMLIRIFWSDLNKFIIIINRFIHIPCLQCKRTQTGNDLSAPFRTMIGNIKNFITLLIVPVLLINITDIRQHRRITNSSPVNRIRNCCGFSVCTVFHKFKHLFCLQLIFILVHCAHLVNLNFNRSGILCKTEFPFLRARQQNLNEQ